MNLENISHLIDLMNRNGLSKLEVCEGDTKILLEKSPAPGSAVITEVQNAAPALPENTDTDRQTLDFNKITEVKSPMVGVFYSAPSPDADPFVTIGSKVQKGDVLCIIEAMKLMNEITAETSGEIVDICLKNGDIAEFGQVLFKIF